MVAFTALFTGLCGLRNKTRPPESIQTENHPQDTTERDNLQHKEPADRDERDNLRHKEPADRDTNAPDHVTIDANPELPLPPARKAALRGTYSCNNMVIQKSGSTKKKQSESLSIQIPRGLSMVKKRDGEEDKSVRMKKPKAQNSILVRPIILGEKCRVLDEEEGDEDQSQRMLKNIIYHPRSLSSISLSRTNSKIDMNVVPVKETSQDSMEKKRSN